MKARRRETDTFPDDDAIAVESLWAVGSVAAEPVVNKVRGAERQRAGGKIALRPPRAGAAQPLRDKQRENESMVEGRFRMPAQDYQLIGELKRRARAGSLVIKKSRLLAAGLRLLCDLDDAQLRKVLASLSAAAKAPRH